MLERIEVNTRWIAWLDSLALDYPPKLCAQRFRVFSSSSSTIIAVKEAFFVHLNHLSDWHSRNDVIVIISNLLLLCHLNAMKDRLKIRWLG